MATFEGNIRTPLRQKFADLTCRNSMRLTRPSMVSGHIPTYQERETKASTRSQPQSKYKTPTPKHTIYYDKGDQRYEKLMNIFATASNNEAPMDLVKSQSDFLRPRLCTAEARIGTKSTVISAYEVVISVLVVWGSWPMFLSQVGAFPHWSLYTLCQTE